MKISGVKGREVLDSRGNPTVECEITLQNGMRASAIVPSGASTGTHEAVELRDNGSRFNGKGVLNAVGNINGKIGKKITGMDAGRQDEIDRILLDLDGTLNKGNLGANAILAVSLAAARAGALSGGSELYDHLSHLSGKKPQVMPVPFSNIINGGVHAGNDLKVQEFMVAPIKARSFSEGCRMVAEIYSKLKNELKAKFGKGAINVGDEGGFAPPLKKTADALELILVALEELGYSKQARLAIDAASSEFFGKGSYSIDGKKLSSGEMVEYYRQLVRDYGLISIEDPFAEDEWEGFSEFTREAGREIQIVADDLTVSSLSRLRSAVEKKCANCLLLKVNQVGSLTESISAANFAFNNDWNVMVSHRSGETEDTFIADLAVALQCRQIKLGAPCRGERTAKYNRLLRIEEMLGSKAKYGWVM